MVRDDRDGGGGVIGARGGRDAPVTGTTSHHTLRKRGWDAHGVILRVPTIAQNHKRYSRRAQRGFGFAMLTGQVEWRSIRAQKARIDDEL